MIDRQTGNYIQPVDVRVPVSLVIVLSIANGALITIAFALGRISEYLAVLVGVSR